MGGKTSSSTPTTLRPWDAKTEASALIPAPAMPRKKYFTAVGRRCPQRSCHPPEGSPGWRPAPVARGHDLGQYLHRAPDILVTKVKRREAKAQHVGIAEIANDATA